MPNLEHVTWSEPTVTSSELAISSRLAPCATNSLIFSIACGVNFARLPLAEGWHSSASWLHLGSSRPPVGRLGSISGSRSVIHPSDNLMPCLGHIVQNRDTDPLLGSALLQTGNTHDDDGGWCAHFRADRADGWIGGKGERSDEAPHSRARSNVHAVR